MSNVFFSAFFRLANVVILRIRSQINTESRVDIDVYWCAPNSDVGGRTNISFALFDLRLFGENSYIFKRGNGSSRINSAGPDFTRENLSIIYMHYTDWTLILSMIGSSVQTSYKNSLTKSRLTCSNKVQTHIAKTHTHTHTHTRHILKTCEYATRCSLRKVQAWRTYTRPWSINRRLKVIHEQTKTV